MTSRQLISQATPLGCLVAHLFFSTAASLGQQPVSFAGAEPPTTAAEVYGQGVRETDWRSPAGELSGFHLPPGFEANLFASEPQIDKPLNMNWGPKGRLWVTSTVEYPYPAKDPSKARDRIVILDDSDGDGQADKATTFASGLNIAMGILPVHDGAIAFSIPNIVYLRDLDGDDRSDQTEVLYGPFDTTRDTHGMINALRLGMDGWIYACHGFNNQSEVTGADGHPVRLHSGNTFRFRPDGSRIEQYTSGQVNPFGMTRDQWGNWYTADCHSKPLTALLRGACYPSFGRPHDGLGFAPDMMEHLHGSTAISGLVHYRSTAFPDPYRGLFYSGNVMTSRINCNALHWNGAKAVARELPDFLTSDDPWFRPVDLQIGPDGAIYVADFYNKIIGHYEVPLEHPGRDRKSGRIWRITYKGERATAEKPTARTSRLDTSWQDGLLSDNQTVRLLSVQNAAWELKEASKSDHASQMALERNIKALLLDEQLPQEGRVACLRALTLADCIKSDELAELIDDQYPIVTTHAVKLGCEIHSAPSAAFLDAVRAAFDSGNAQLQAAAIRCLGTHGDAADCIRTLRRTTNAGDPALRHTALIASRDLLRNPHILDNVSEQLHAIREIQGAYGAALRGLDTAEGANKFLAFALAAVRNKDQRSPGEAAVLSDALDLAIEQCHMVSMASICDAIELIDEPLPQQVRRLSECARRLSGVGMNVSPEISQDSQLRTLSAARERLAGLLIERCNAMLHRAGPPIAWRPVDESTSWSLQARNRPDGTTTSLRSSHTLGEQYVGRMKSGEFSCPEELSFRIAGHNGYPEEADHRKNYVRLVDARTEQELRREYPPRSDVARQVMWQLGDTVGRPVRLEIVDGDSAGAYAWLAVGEFSLTGLNESPVAANADALVQCLAIPIGRDARGERTATAFHARRRTELRELGERLPPRENARLIAACAAASGRDALATIASAAIAAERSDLLSWKLLDQDGKTEQLVTVSTELCKSLPAAPQQTFAKQLAQSRVGCEILAELLQSNFMPTAALRDIAEVLPSGVPDEIGVIIESGRESAKDSGATDAQIAVRVRRLSTEAVDLSVGKKMFTTHCANCHKLGGQGQLIGPQLDGAVSRSFERLAEDILAPNRNVDRAFRTSSLLLDDDSVVAGLVVESPGGRLEVTMQDGKKRTLSSESVVQRKDSETSLMPSNFSDVMDEQQLASVIRYLKSYQKNPQP